MARPLTSSSQSTDLYLGLLKHSLTRTLTPERVQFFQPKNPGVRKLYHVLEALLDRRGLVLMQRSTNVVADRAVGRDWPVEAETMIGLARLDNLQMCIETILREGIPGDLIETGVWRGGAVILMRAVLKAYGETKRLVWAADSYAGLPTPNAEAFPADAGDFHHTFRELRCGLDDVKLNFERYGLLDDQVKFLVGWFKDTLPTAPIEQLALVRLDGDMYESTIQGLSNLYPKLSPGGFLIVDDYGAVPSCQRAVLDFRDQFTITESIHSIDDTGVYWRKEGLAI